MAKKENEEKSLDQIQREIAELDLQTKQLNYAEAKKRNELFLQHEEQRHLHNRQRQSDLAQERAAHAATVEECRHKSGGSPTNILKGGGIGSFSTISRAMMPDGVTFLLQCPRCRMMEYFRRLTPKAEKLLAKGDPEKYEHYMKVKDLFDTAIDEGLEHAITRGPTFFFQNEQGIPVVPEMR